MMPKWMETYKERNGAIPITVPDGHLEGFLRIIFSGMNLDYPVSDNGGPYGIMTEYRFEDGEKQRVYVSMHRPKGIVEYTRDGHFALGISGKDWWYSALPMHLNGDSEASFDEGLKQYGLYRVADLGYRPSSVVVAVHKDSKIRNLPDFIKTYSNGRHLGNLGTELVGLSNSFITVNGIIVEGRLIDSQGKTESVLRDRIAEAIIEIAETGNSVTENDGKILTPCLIRKTTPHAVGRLDTQSIVSVKRFMNDFKGRFDEVLGEMKSDAQYAGSFQDHSLLKKLYTESDV